MSITSSNGGSNAGGDNNMGLAIIAITLLGIAAFYLALKFFIWWQHTANFWG